ncbi:ubiquitin-protein transferase [Aureococcus anophagefferens]|nr:ubiquitin-protein transferase [Aureococcus anophagefferens]
MDPQNPYLHSLLGVIIGIVVSRVSTFQSVSILLIILLQLPLIKNFDRRKLRHVTETLISKLPFVDALLSKLLLPATLRCDFGWDAAGWRPADSPEHLGPWRAQNFWHLGADGRRYRSARTSFELFYEGSRWVVRPTGEPAYGLRSSDGASRWRPTASSGLWEAHSGGGWLQMPWVQVSAVDGGAAAEFTEHALRSASAPVTLGDASKWDAHVETKQQIFDDLDQGSGEWTRTLVKRGLLKRAAGHMARGRGDSREAVASLFVKARRHPWLAARIAGPRCQFDEAERDAIAGLVDMLATAPAMALDALAELVQLDDAVDGRGRVRDRDDAALRDDAGARAARWLGAVDAAVRLPPPRLRFGASVLEEVCVFATGKRPRVTHVDAFCSRKFLKHCLEACAPPRRPPAFLDGDAVEAAARALDALRDQLIDEARQQRRRAADGDDDDSDADARTDDALGAAALLDAERCPGAWRCPITHDIMRDPVLVVESVGNTYERRAIEAWFARRGPLTDPKSGLPVSSSVVVPNLLLASLIRDWCEKCARAAASDDDDDDSDPRKTSDDEDVA